EARLKRMAQLGNQKVVSHEEVKEAEAVLARAKAELARVEAEMPYLIGKQAAWSSETDLSNTQFFLNQLHRSGEFALSSASDPAIARGLHWLALQQAAGAAGAGTVPETIRKALDKPISVDFKNAPFSN